PPRRSSDLDLTQARQPDGRRTGHTSGTRRAAASTAGTRGSGRAPTAPGSPSTASGASECWNATSSAWGRPRLGLLTQVCSRSASGLANTSKDYIPVGAASRVATRSLLQALHQRGPPRVYGLMPVSGLEFGPFHTATGAQSPAVLAAQRDQGKRENEGVPDQRLQVDPVVDDPADLVGFGGLVRHRIRVGEQL